MNIQIEFRRLQELILTTEGWQQVEDAWMIAINHEKRDGEWYKKTDSAGNPKPRT